MAENHQDKTESKLTATEDKLWLPPLSAEAQKRLKRLHQKSFAQRMGFAGKTPWDWMQLLIVPLLIALLGFTFTGAQYLASLQIAESQQQEATLKTYLDDMSDLLLNHNLSKDKSGDNVSQIARAKTLTVFSRLTDTQRKARVLQFLYQADLIGFLSYGPLRKHGPIIDLFDADMRGINLSGAILDGANLWNTNLSGADLSGADLIRADLSDADLMEANLRKAKLRYANLIRANFYGADLSDAWLSQADLNSAFLSGANLSGADLSGADLVWANLSDAKLYKANLSHSLLRRAILSRADLSDADLRSADLRSAHLSGANLDKTILKGARYNTKEILKEIVRRDSQGKIVAKIPPTEWPQGFDPKAAGAIEDNTWPEEMP